MSVSPQAIKNIYAVWVYVNNIEESRKFYEEVIGLPFKPQNKGWVEFDLGGVSFGILEHKKDAPLKPQKTRIMFEVTDIAGFSAELKKRGVKFVGEA